MDTVAHIVKNTMMWLTLKGMCFTYCLDDNKWLEVAFEHCPNEWMESLSFLICIVVLK